MTAEWTARSWSGIDGLRDALGAAEGLGALDPLCNDSKWLVAHSQAFVDPDAIFGWNLEDGNDAVACLAFQMEPSRGRFALPRAILAGDGTFDSDYLDLRVRSGLEASVAEQMIDLMAKDGRVQAVVLAGVPDESPMLAAVRAHLESRGLPSRASTCDCMAVPLPDTFDAYLKRLKSRMRSKVRQAVRRADEAGATFHWCDDAGAIEQHLAGLFELHASRWSEVGESGSFADDRRRAFYRLISDAYLERGELRFARLELDGAPVAYQFGILREGIYYQLQEGYLPETGKLRTATALRAIAVEKLIDEGATSYDFMAGASRHKQDWGGVDRPTTTLAFALPRWRARLAYGARALLDKRG